MDRTVLRNLRIVARPMLKDKQRKDDRPRCVRNAPGKQAKIRYETQQQADAEAIRIGILGKMNVSKLYVYQCNACGGWHLTRMAQKMRKAE